MECNPTAVVRVIATLSSPDRDLRCSQGGCRALTANQHTRVEPLHQLRRSAVIDLPQRRDDARGAGVEEAAGEPDQSFALDFSPERGLACAQHHKLRREPQIINVVEAKESIPRLPGAVEPRQYHARE